MKKVKTLRDLGGRRRRLGRLATALWIILILAVGALLGYLTYLGTWTTEKTPTAESSGEESPGEESTTEESQPEESVTDSFSEESEADESQMEESKPEESSSVEAPVESQPQTTIEVDTSVFDNTVFIGDSRTQGLQLSTGLTNARFLAERNMAVNRCEDKLFRLSDGSMGTMYQALAEKQYEKVYIMFGVNELGWPSASSFADYFAKVIDRVQEIQPNATIYVQSILPITKARSDSDSIYNNTNVNLFNAAIETMVATRDVVYLDVASAFRDKTGALFADAATDGVHMTAKYCWQWLQYLAENQES